jgi:hypothetical protein
MEIQLDKLRRVEFTMRAFRTFKESTGKSLIQDGLKNPTEEDLFELTYSGLIGGDKNCDLSKEDLEDYVNMPILMQVLEHFADPITGNPDDKTVKK